MSRADGDKNRFYQKGQILFFLSTLVLGVALLFGLPRLTIPLGISYVLYLVISPIFPKLRKIGLNKTWSLVIMFAGIVFFTVYPIVKVSPSIKSEAENFQYYLPKIEHYLKKNYLWVRYEIKSKAGIEIGDKYLQDALDYGKTTSKSILLSIPKILASLIEWIFVVPLFLFFLLKDGRKFKHMILRLAPNSVFERFYYLFHQFNKQLGDYIFAKFIEASIVGVVITLGLLIIGVRFSFLLGLLAGITNIIPYVGPLLGMIPAVIMALAEYGVSATTGAIVILYLVANVIDLALVFPILVSKIVDLHPIVVVISVILGSQYLGVVGMVISIPLAAACKLLIQEVFGSIYSATVK